MSHNQLVHTARPTYLDCVAEFRRAAKEAGGMLYEENAWGRMRGLMDEELVTSAAYLGPENATRVICITSGMHGAELPMGTMVQGRALREWKYLYTSRDMGLLCIHALNPWGSSHSHRNDEKNRDPNRANILVAPGETVPTPPEYEELHPYINPRVPDDVRYVKCLGAVVGYWVWNGIKVLRLGEGLKKLKKVIGSGQGAFPNGVFYAGTGRNPTRTNLVLRCIIRTCIPRSVRHVMLLDIHTGIGWPPGKISLISHYPSESYKTLQMQRWYNQPLEKTIDNDSVAVHSQGVIESVFEKELAEFPNKCEFFGLCDEIAIEKLIRSSWTVSKRNCVGVYHYADPFAPLAVQSREEMDRDFVLPTPKEREHSIREHVELLRNTVAGVRMLPS